MKERWEMRDEISAVNHDLDISVRLWPCLK